MLGPNNAFRPRKHIGMTHAMDVVDPGGQVTTITPSCLELGVGRFPAQNTITRANPAEQYIAPLKCEVDGIEYWVVMASNRVQSGGCLGP